MVDKLFFDGCTSMIFVLRDQSDIEMSEAKSDVLLFVFSIKQIMNMLLLTLILSMKLVSDMSLSKRLEEMLSYDGIHFEYALIRKTEQLAER